MKIDIVNATKRLKRATVVDNVSLEFESGKVYGLCGYNGCGKTMLMRMIAGLIKPTTGSVSVDGRRLGEDIDFPESIGLLIESPAFLDNYTALDNLKLIASIKRVVSEEEIRRSLDRVQLDPDDIRKFKKFSLGMKQRLGIAAAIMEHPDLLLLDEPTNALDVDGVELAAGIIQEEKARGALIILACHDKDFLRSAADVIIQIERGKITEIEELSHDAF